MLAYTYKSAGTFKLEEKIRPQLLNPHCQGKSCKHMLQ